MKTDCKTKRKKPTTTFSFFYVVRLFFRLLPAPRRPYRPASLLYELTFSGRLASPAGRRRFCLFCFFFGLRSSLSFVSLLSFSFCCSSGWLVFFFWAPFLSVWSPVLPSFTEFYRVLPSFTEFYLVLPSFTESFTEFFPVFPSFT